MSLYDQAAKLIDRFGRALGLEGLRLEGGTHSCALEFDGTVVVTFEFHEASGQMILTSLLPELPAAADEPLLRALMNANYMDFATVGITLGLVPQSQRIAFMQARSLTELDDAAFERMVEAFVNHVEQWGLRLQDTHKPQGTSPDGQRSAIDAASHPTGEPRSGDGLPLFG